MIPSFEIFWHTVYTFGLFLALSLILFFWMSNRLSKKKEISNIFSDHMLVFFLSAFLIGRLVFILTQWEWYKDLSVFLPHRFLFMADYNLSFAGIILGISGAFWFFSKRLPEKQKKTYLDIFILSFLFASVVGYFGSFISGQLYGTLPGDVPIPVVYAFLSGVTFSVLYITQVLLHEKKDGLVGYIGIGVFMLMILIGEWFNDNFDIIAELTQSIPPHSFRINTLQIVALIALIIPCVHWFKKKKK